MKLTSILAFCLGGAKALSPGDCAFTAVFADEARQKSAAFAALHRHVIICHESNQSVLYLS